MVMVLNQVVPFGRTFDEYVQIFNLTAAELNSKILGVGDGPASFNATATQQGYEVVSVDPIYCFASEEIQARFEAVVDNIIEQIKATPKDWIWTYHRSPDGLRANRLKALHEFLADYEIGKAQKRYLVGELPHLPFADQQFSLALCSHLLFLYSEQLDGSFHVQAIQAMLRVASEVRIFPLLTLSLQPSPHLDLVLTALQEMGYRTMIQPVAYELQKGGNQMLVVRQP